MGKATTALYILIVAVLATLFGLLFDAVSSVAGWDFSSLTAGHEHEMMAWYKVIAAVIFGLLLMRAFGVRLYKKIRKKPAAKTAEKAKEPNTMKLTVKGMSCQHCVGNVKKALSEADGVTGVEVSLEKELAEITGKELSAEKLIDAVKAVGYEAEVKS